MSSGLLLKPNHPARASDAYIPTCIHDISGSTHATRVQGDSANPSIVASETFGDCQIWAAINYRLRAFARSGLKKLTILDAGCGPGTWLCRTVARAHELGFAQIEARGFDISDKQVAIAQAYSADIRAMSGVCLRFQSGDITMSLPEKTESVDLCLCINGVLNHVEARDRKNVSQELARVTNGALIVSVRSTGSNPLSLIDRIEAINDYRQDNATDRLQIDFKDGRHVEVCSHLFQASELEALFEPHILVVSVSGLDLFHTRFQPDPRWNPPEGPERDDFLRELGRLEHDLASHPNFIDHADHILLIAEPDMLRED